MEVVLAAVVGALYATGLYLVLQRSLVRVLFGLGILANAVNLLLFASAGLTRGVPALVLPGAQAPRAPFADPLPQALILTAIVITFGVQAFAIALVYRARLAMGTDDGDAMTAERDAEGAP